MDNWNSDGYGLETNMNSDDDDEMAAFEAECDRRLKQEHERRAREEKESAAAEAAQEKQEEAAPEPEPEPEPIPEPEPQPEPEPESKPEPKPEPKPKKKQEDELAAIMQVESNESMMHASARSGNAYMEEETEEEKNENLPKWLRLLFTVLLLILGGIGMYTMLCMNYHSYIFDPLCFIEITICLLTAVGINASLIQFRVGKEVIMRVAAFALFGFYCVYAADSLFLKKLLADGIDKDNFISYAKGHINADVVDGLSAMSTTDMFSCAMMVVPFAFMLLMLFKPFREIVLYMLTIAFLFFAVGAVRMLCLVGSFNLSQGCMALAGAIAAYLLFVFPPFNRLLYNSGLLLWEYDDDDDY